MIVDLVKMKSGESGIITEIHGGCGMRERLKALGIWEGKEIKKISAQFIRGPVVVEAGRTQVGIGFGMARRIFVEIKGAARAGKKSLESGLDELKKKKEELENSLKEVSKQIEKKGGE